MNICPSLRADLEPPQASFRNPPIGGSPWPASAPRVVPPVRRPKVVARGTRRPAGQRGTRTPRRACRSARPSADGPISARWNAASRSRGVDPSLSRMAGSSRAAQPPRQAAGRRRGSAGAPPPLAKLPEQDGHQAAWLFVLDVHAAQVLLELGHPAPVLFRPAGRPLLRLVVAALAHDPRGVGRTRRRSWGWKQASLIRRSRARRRSVKRGPGGRRPGSGIRAIRSLPSCGRVRSGHTDGRHRPIGRRP